MSRYFGNLLGAETQKEHQQQSKTVPSVPCAICGKSIPLRLAVEQDDKLICQDCYYKLHTSKRASKKSLTLEIDKPYFSIRLYQDMLKMDLKGSTKNATEEALENKPVLRETIGGILSIFAPLHIRLSDVDMVKMDKTGKVKLILPRRRDITIPLKSKEAKKLVDKLNELIPKEKQKR